MIDCEHSIVHHVADDRPGDLRLDDVVVPLGQDEQGATVAAPIFRDFMKEALKDAPPTPFRVAPGIEEVPIDWKSGNPVPPGTPGAVLEAFKAGTAPGEANAPAQDESVPGNGTASVSQGTAPPQSVSEGTGGLY